MKTPEITALRNGIYRAPDNAARLRKAARRAAASWIAVDLGAVRGKRALLDALARVFMFPDSFGGNWDALADCLQDLSWLPERGWVVVLGGIEGFAAEAPADHALLLDILAAAASYWRQHERIFIVLVDGGAGLPEFSAP